MLSWAFYGLPPGKLQKENSAKLRAYLPYKIIPPQQDAVRPRSPSLLLVLDSFEILMKATDSLPRKICISFWGNSKEPLKALDLLNLMLEDTLRSGRSMLSMQPWHLLGRVEDVVTSIELNPAPSLSIWFTWETCLWLCEILDSYPQSLPTPTTIIIYNLLIQTVALLLITD